MASDYTKNREEIERLLKMRHKVERALLRRLAPIASIVAHARGLPGNIKHTFISVQPLRKDFIFNWQLDDPERTLVEVWVEKDLVFRADPLELFLNVRERFPTFCGECKGRYETEEEYCGECGLELDINCVHGATPEEAAELFQHLLQSPPGWMSMEEEFLNLSEEQKAALPDTIVHRFLTSRHRATRLAAQQAIGARRERSPGRSR